MRLGRPGAQFPGKIIAKEFAKAQHGKAATKQQTGDFYHG